MRDLFGVSLLLVAAMGLSASGCDDKPSANAAPESSALAPAKPTSDMAKSYQVATSGSKVTFLMEAPVEKIHGEAPDSMHGELFIDLKDLSKSTGLVTVDLRKLELFQQKREDEKQEYSEKSKSELQNKHAKNWLEIGEDAPEETRKKNENVEFKISKVENVSEKDVTKLSGAERKVTATVTGDFRLHGRSAAKSAKLELTFKFDGDKPTEVAVKTLEPFAVPLEQYDVRPREAFGKLADKTLGALSSKVNKEAKVSLDFSAKIK